MEIRNLSELMIDEMKKIKVLWNCEQSVQRFKATLQVNLASKSIFVTLYFHNLIFKQ
jgi:hypothetical protein